jgi:ABC-type Na+ efflux pump permease subunit
MNGTLKHIWLIAAREFRQIAATKGFWITMLILPASMMIPTVIARFADTDDAQRVMLIDPAGAEAPEIAEQLKIAHQRQVLTSLARYVQRQGLQQVNPSAPWAHSDRWYGDAEVLAFARSGGAKAALGTLAKAVKPGTRPFSEPRPRFEIVPTPSEIAAATPEHMAMLVRARIEPPSGSREKKLNYALYIPATFGASNVPVRLWAADTPDRELMQTMQSVLTRDLRLRFLESAGTAPDVARAAGTLAPIVAIDVPAPGEGKDRIQIRSALPLVSSVMLLMSLMLSGAWMLQSVVEEKSNKLLETMLACVSPNALMYGKLIGTVAIGLVMVAVWIACGVAAAYSTQGAVADFLRPALAPLSSPGLVAAMIYFFVAGYLVVSMVYLAIGAVSESMQDSQNYLMPVILAIVLPFSFIATSVLNDTPSTGIQVMSWLPIWTPFIMLARLGTGVPLWELLGTGTVLAVFIVLEFLLLGRVFRASLLSAGQKPSLARLGRLMRMREAA